METYVRKLKGHRAESLLSKGECLAGLAAKVASIVLMVSCSCSAGGGLS